MDRLIHLLSVRSQEYWQPLATAIGVPEAVHKSVEMLSGDMLARGFAHPDCFVKERVDAIAAWDESLLHSVARTWESPWRRSSLLLIEAWRAALRFLRTRWLIPREDVETPELMEEVGILWDEEDQGRISWNEALEFLGRERYFSYDVVRKMSRRWRLLQPLPKLEELIEGPAWLLPILRGHARTLDDSVKEFLLKASRKCLIGNLRRMPYTVIEETYEKSGHRTSVHRLPRGYRSLRETPLEGNLSDAPPIIELCREFAPESLESLAEQLAEKIEHGNVDPREIGNVVYLLVTKWCLP